MIVYIYKMAAVYNSNDLLSCESSEMASTSLSKSTRDSRRKSGDSDLSDKREEEGYEWAKAVAFPWEEHLHIQLYWELLLHYLRSTSEPLCMCTCSKILWIIHRSLFFFWVCLCEPYLFFPPPQCNTFFIYIENITSWQPNLNSALFSYCLRMFNMQGCLTVTQLSKNISIYK